MTNHSAWRAIGLALAVTLSGCGGGGDAPPTELPQSLAVAAPSTAEPGAEVAFSSDLAPPPSGLTWQWRFGDGGTSDDLQPSHSWSSPGQYEVTLTVSNEAGQTRQATQTVTVGRFSLIK